MTNEIFSKAMVSYNTGLAHLENNEYKDAVDCFNDTIDTILSVGEDNITKEMYLYIADAFYRIAGTYVISGNYTDAIINFKSGLLACRNGDMLKTAVAGIIYYRLGELNYITKKPERMIYYYKKAVEGLKVSASKMIDEIMTAYERMIFALEDLDRNEEALEMLDEYETFAKTYIKDQDEDPAYYLFEKGNIYNKIGKYKEALNCYSRSFEIVVEVGKFNDNIMKLFYNIAIIEYEQFHELEIAAAMYKRAIVFGMENNLEKDEILETCAYNAAKVELELGNYKDALKYAEYAIKLMEGHDFDYEHLDENDKIRAYLLAGNIAIKTESYSNAMKYLEQAEEYGLQIDNNVILREVYYALARCYFELGDFESVVEYATEADVRYEDHEWDNKELIDICDLESKAYYKMNDEDMGNVYAQRKNIIEEENNIVE